MIETLTGKRRFRAHVNLFGKSWLVLQVEVHCEEPRTVGGIVPHLIEPSTYEYWRDAIVTDLTAHEAAQAVATRQKDQYTRLKLETLGFSFSDLCIQRALILQVRTHFYEPLDPSREPDETWRDAGIDDLGMKLEVTG